MVLSDKDIKKAIKNKQLIISPKINFANQLGSCSIDLRLGSRFRVFEYSRFTYIDTRAKNINNEYTREIKIREGESFVMQPGDFVLALTLEKLTIGTNLLGRLEGRSSLGRLGIVVHSTASVFDPGWDGQAVLELGNLGRLPVVLYSGMRICAMTFEQLSSEADIPYSKKNKAKYKIQTSPHESKIQEE